MTYKIQILLSLLLFFISCTSIRTNVQQQTNNRSPQTYSIREFDPPIDSLEQICTTTDCRDSLRIRLTLQNGEIFDHTFYQKVPYIYKNQIVLFPGEQMEILLTESDGNVDVKKVEPGKGNLSLSFFQEGNFMWLSFRNHSKSDIKYHCLMRPNPDTLYYETSSCPVLAGKSAGETWQHPIMQLLLHDIRFVNNYRVCDY